jgi:hypothetical protein
MKTSPVKVIVIHDDLNENDPLLVVLKEQYGNENVLLFKKSQEGLDYVLTHISEKSILVLDLNFKPGEPTGVEVFEDIRQKTALIYIIIMTASDLNSISNEDLRKFINHDALALEYSTSDYKKIIQHVDKAAHQLDVRVGGALEQWIGSHTEQEKNEPYLTTRDGHTYSLNQILYEIRLQSPFGMEIEKNILMLAIDMLARGKKQING